MIEHSTARVANFNAGPAAMPQVGMKRIQAEMLDYRGRGLSVLEMSHRSAEFADIADAVTDQAVDTLVVFLNLFAEQHA